MYTLPQNAVAGSIYFSQYLDTTKDIVVSFDYACYGTQSTGSEGFCVYFGTTYAPNIFGGGAGPGLAYGTVSNVDIANVPKSTSAALRGIDSGIIGIGFDLTGNYGCNSYFNSGYSDKITNSIAIRGDFGSGNIILARTENLNSLTFGKTISLYQQLTAIDQEPIFNRVRVRMTDFGRTIIVDLKSPGDLDFTNYLTYNAAAVPWPVSVRCGLGFANGESGDTRFKIKGFNINGVTTTAVAQDTFTYDTDKTTLSATVNYKSVPYFNYYDIMDTENTRDGILNHTYTGSFSTTNPAISGIPLIYATPGALNVGAPYEPGDQYVNINITP